MTVIGEGALEVFQGLKSSDPHQIRSREDTVTVQSSTKQVEHGPRNQNDQHHGKFIPIASAPSLWYVVRAAGGG